jgi:hypothetical protein
LDKASTHGLDATAVRKRLFAISSVSGSSVGAVMTVAALAAGGQDTRVPCRQHKFSDWYGDVVQNWRGCLESLMAGDFLTPTFIGLAFHDMIPFRPWPDRATILEQSWNGYSPTVWTRVQPTEKGFLVRPNLTVHSSACGLPRIFGYRR